MFTINEPEKGFSLIELMVSLVMAAVIYASVTVTFIENKSEMHHLTERAAAVSQLNSGLLQIQRIVRSSLSDPWGIAGTTPVVNSAAATDDIYIDAYDSSINNISPYLVERHIEYDSVNKTIFLYMDGLNRKRKLIENVEFFKVFDDTITPRAGYTGIPNALPAANKTLPDGTASVVNGYTVLVEIYIDILGKKESENLNSRGVAVPNKKQAIWRYVQIYPQNPIIF